MLTVTSSAVPNVLSKRGLKTHLVFDPKNPFSVKYIMGLVAIPKQFDRVRDMIVTAQGVTLVSDTGLEVSTPVNTGFLH